MGVHAPILQWRLGPCGKTAFGASWLEAELVLEPQCTLWTSPAPHVFLHLKEPGLGKGKGGLRGEGPLEAGAEDGCLPGWVLLGALPWKERGGPHLCCMASLPGVSPSLGHCQQSFINQVS